MVEGIPKNWSWTAYITNMSRKFFYEKQRFFGEKYNLLGIDYYLSGIYSNYFLDSLPPADETNLNSEFDWRKKHDAHLPMSFYWDGDPNQGEEGNGWMTGIREQDCESCAAYGAIAAYEGFLYLYFNQHLLDINKNEIRVSERDAFNCSWYYYMYVGCNCNSRKERTTILDYIVNTGVVDEECYRWPQSGSSFCEGQMDDCSQAIDKCSESDYIFSANTSLYFSTSNYAQNNFNNRSDYLKSLLIEHGPLLIQVNKLFGSSLEHVIALIGFTTNENGQIIWIMKNSWGLDPIYCSTLPPQAECNAGYVYSPIPLEYNSNSISMRPYVYTFEKPEITYSSPLIPHFQNQQYDADNDGYYNWGLADTIDISFSPPCAKLQDWNDNNNRIGPVDENYYGVQVEPDIKVYLGHPDWGGRLIENYSFCSFDDNDLSTLNEITIYIKNPGTAQLNLSDPPVEELSDENNCFSINVSELEDKICHIDNSNVTQFTITFSSQCSSLSAAKYKIDVSQCDEDVLEDFEFTLVYYNCDDASEIRTIQHAETISGIVAENRDIVVETNATLTITGTLGMAPEGDIAVKPGGSLIIDGGRITKLCYDNWNGIDVWGNTALSQYPISNQGYLKVINGGCIEHADTGVQVSRLFNGSPSSNWNGGVIQCDSAVFNNNVVDVDFYSYNNFNPVTLAKIPNRSAFKQTKFLNDKICEKDLYVGLQGVDGIFFRGCIFKNSVDKIIQNCQSINKGTGIYSFNSGFYLVDECLDNNTPCESSQLCRFENLKYGIYALNAEFNEIISIDTAVFYNTYRGIYMNLVDYPEIIRNQFIYDENFDILPTYTESYGLDLEHCRSFNVEENQFINSSWASNILGLQVLNAGPYAHDIYNNSFSGLNTGISAAGENRDNVGTGLCIKCNDFSNCLNDIHVTDDGGLTGYYGIAFFQGEKAPIPLSGDPDPTYAAGNTFTEIEGSYTNYINDSLCYSFEYTYHGNDINPDIKTIPDPTSPEQPTQHIDLIPDNEVTYNSKDEACPSNLGAGIDIPSEMNMMASESSMLNAYEDTLNLFVDGGNTETLNQDVQLSFPDEALEIRQELLNSSPYLSDAVMKSSIAKENVLPNVMIRDVLVANPQSAKSPSLLQSLDDRIVPMPDYMMNEIMMGQYTYGNKELLEQKLSKHKRSRDFAFAKLMRHYHSDTINSAAAGDSIISLLYDQDYLGARYQLSMYYLSKYDSANAYSTLNNIPIDFDLTSNEQSAWQLYSDLFDINWEIMNDTNAIDSVHISGLYDIYNSQNTRPALHARNILIGIDEIIYDEPIFLPSVLKVTPIWQKQPDIKPGSKLYVYPNPAHSFFIVEYSMDSFSDKAYLMLTDMSGKQMKSIKISCQQNQIVIPCEDLPNGVYLIQLLKGNKTIESKKIIVSK